MPPVPPERPATPTRWKAGMFLVKARALQVARGLRDAEGGAPRRLSVSTETMGGSVLAESRTRLYANHGAAEFGLQAGKVQNLRVAAACLNGVMIRELEVFSFWAHVPRPARSRGFAAGRELREGCMVPSVGGGLCQLSNALYEVALRAGCEIIERHAHSRQVPGSMAATGRDATVFWNYVDLRFRPGADCRLEVELTRDELVVRLRSPIEKMAGARDGSSAEGSDGAPTKPLVESCETCGVTDCFRNMGGNPSHQGITAWLVDGWWPEFDVYLQRHGGAGDWLFLPIRGGRVANYRWAAQKAFAQVRHAPFETLRRSWLSRRLADQGASRQRGLLEFDARLAACFARRLPVEATHMVVSQPLLPHLWRAGTLGGRTYGVLMTRLPMPALQATLDRAAAMHPGCGTLVDFRAPPLLATAEAAALAEARYWITPHESISRMAGSRAVKLPWQMPPARSDGGRGGGRDVLFPASSLARKGAYELAEAARTLGLRVQIAGRMLEGADCWRGVDTAPARPDWAGVGVAALPAWVEHQPRALLKAVAAGLPVIAGEGCGLQGVPGVTTVGEGDVAMLTDALAKVCRVGRGACRA